MPFLQHMAEIIREQVEQTKSRRPWGEVCAEAKGMPPARDFVQGLRPKNPNGGGMKIIAEVKKASPSKGLIREDFEPVKIARIYEENGAAAISVLTQPRYFQGAPEYLAQVRRIVSLPVMRKEFIIDPYQVYEARAIGADAMLLIAGMLEAAQLQDLYQLGVELGMQPLVEVNNLAELDRTLRLFPPLVGINNRNLQTLEMDTELTFKMLPDIPAEVLVVSESGIHSREDIVRLEAAGVSACLIGEELMRAGDIGLRLRQLLGQT